MSLFWNVWIIGLTVTCLVLITWVLFANRKIKVTKDGEPVTTGHVYDGIEEYDNPMPKWWFGLFVITLVFTVFYLAAYPGLGSYKGFFNWTSTNQWEKEMAAAEKTYGPIFAKFADMPLEEVALDPQANKIGARLYADNCAICHGSDARGAMGFPDLTDNDWLYGGTPEKILETIQHGRVAAMPPWAAALGEDGIDEMSHYVMSLSNRDHDERKAANAKSQYMNMCAACHAADGTGNQMLGAPNLTDNIWLYGGSQRRIVETLNKGRNGVMPAQKDLLQDQKIHILAGYVYGLSLDKETK